MRKAIVLGGYGLIGAACARGLVCAGYSVLCVGRSPAAARSSGLPVSWAFHDISRMTPAQWAALIGDADVVVNASGALQSGPRDDLHGIHVRAVSRMVEAAGPGTRIIQISAAGASEHASTEFLRGKAWGDGLIAARAADWVILRPVMVLAPEAYGGTALLRAAASAPLMLPAFLPGSPVSTVHIDDLVAAVLASADGRVPSGTVADITEEGHHRLADLTAAIRRWQGFPEPVVRFSVPRSLMRAGAALADGLSLLGWRSPLRSTALRVLEDGVMGDPSAWADAGGPPCRPLAASLTTLPSTRQERVFARAYLLFPLAVAALSLFWIASGLIALARPDAALAILPAAGGVGEAVVYGGAVIDVLIGVAVLFRRWVRPAALAMISISFAYLMGSLLVAPALWVDPLGPMIKVVPATLLAAFVWLMGDER